MDYLVFRLYGPLASWGQAAVGGDRPTGLYPTRSAIVGILAAALGIKRDQESRLNELNQSVAIAVKQTVPSSLMRDYHTTQVPSFNKKIKHLTRRSELKENKLNTILSSRDYRCDGLWIVAINLKTTDFTLEQIKQALITPVFNLYLGRKSCPLGLPLQPRIVCDTDIKSALDIPFPTLTHSAKEDALWLAANNWVTYYWEGDKSEFKQGTVITTRPWDNPLSKMRWQFEQRVVHQISLEEV